MHPTEKKFNALLRLAIQVDKPALRTRLTQAAIGLHCAWRDLTKGVVAQSSAAIADAANNLDDVSQSLALDDEGDTDD